MPLILTVPNAQPIRTYKNGVKVIRLHEFINPDTVTASTESDPMSLCGTVIRETQTIAYSGTDPNKTIIGNMFSSSEPTVIITPSELGLRDNWIYTGFISCRAEGDIDVTKRNSTHTFLKIGTNTAAITTYALDSDGDTLFGPHLSNAMTPRPETTPYYKIVMLGGSLFNDGAFTEGGEAFALKAATGTGGTFEWLLDCLYLVPIAAWEEDGPFEDAHFRTLLHDSDFEPIYDWDTDTYDETQDDSFVDWLGKYSVLYAASNGYLGGTGAVFADFQEGNNEHTTNDVHGKFGPSNWLLNPSSTLTIASGSHYVPSHAVDEDSFDRTVTKALGADIGVSDNLRTWRQITDDPLEASGGGFSCDGDVMKFENGKYNDLFPQFFPVVGNEGDPGDSVSVALGLSQFRTGASSTSQGHHILPDLHHGIIQVKVSTNHIPVAGLQMILGFMSSADENTMAVVADIPSAGVFGLRGTAALNAYLMYFDSTHVDRGVQFGKLTGVKTQEIIDGPIALDTSYVAGEWINLKLEMQWYYFRAKAWLDGDSEPDWQMEGRIPSGVVDDDNDNILYPWDDPDDGSFGSSRRGAWSLNYPTLCARHFRPNEDTAGNSTQFTVNPTRTVTVSWDDFILDYDAHGESPTDVHIRMDKYDDSINYGEKIIGHENQRILIATPGRYTFNGDDNGVKFSVWKENGAPETQAAVLGSVLQRQILGGPIDLDLRFRPWEANEVD